MEGKPPPPSSFWFKLSVAVLPHSQSLESNTSMRWAHRSNSWRFSHKLCSKIQNRVSVQVSMLAALNEPMIWPVIYLLCATKPRKEFSLARNSERTMSLWHITHHTPQRKTVKVEEMCGLGKIFEVWISRHLTSKTLCEVNNDEHRLKLSQMCWVHYV